MIIALEREEDDISLRRRMLHGRIDILRAERERRRRGLHVDPADLGPILGGSPAMSHVYCPECGFQNPEAANYCARCGAYLRRDEHGETTLSLGPDEVDEELLAAAELRALRSSCGPEAAGRGRASRSAGRADADRPLARLRRVPRRRHRLAPPRGDRPRGRRLRDPRPRQPQRDVRQPAPDRVVGLSADDEVQIGKYRMTFLLP